jgi:STE24 endopeptidase
VPGLARKSAAITAFAAGSAFALLAALVVPWDWVPGGELRPVTASALFTPEQIARAEAYASTSRYLGWASYAVSMAVTVLLGLTSGGSRLLRRIGGRWRWWLAVAAGALLLTLIGRLVTLPFAVAGHRHRLSYGLSNQAWDAWAVDVAKSLLVGWVLTCLLLLVVVGAARRFPRSWFAWAGGAAVGLTVLVSFGYPIVVEPVFNRFTPMPAGPFKESVLDQADAQGVRIDDVLVADASRRTTTLNAYVSGFGGTRRVVVYDNLLNDLPPEQALTVVAHELAHAENDDVLVGTALGAFGAAFGITVLALVLDTRWVRRRAGITGPADPAAVAVILALVSAGTFVATPVQSTISRAVEARADRDALAATGDDGAFVAMQRRLALRSLADPTPPRLAQVWWGTHPTVLERAGLPVSLRAAEGSSKP